MAGALSWRRAAFFVVLIMSLALPVATQAAESWSSPLVLRAVERILVVITAGLCLTLGFKLFGIVAAAKSDAEFKTDNMVVKLRSVAPGTFFALFGATVLIYSVSTQVKLVTEGGQEVYYGFDLVKGGSAKEDRQNVVGALNTIGITTTLLASGNVVGKDQMNQTSKAVEYLLPLKWQAIDLEFGPGESAKYRAMSMLRDREPAAFAKQSDAAKRHFETVQRFAERTLAD